MANTKLAYIGIVGKPNAGKSTLINLLVGEKVSIVADKPQTTRQRILGVLTLEDAQFIFLDTPGWFPPKHLLGEYMQKTIKKTIEDSDIVLYVIDSSVELDEDNRTLLKFVKDQGKPYLVLLNKIDMVSPKVLEERKKEVISLGVEEERIMEISALYGTNKELLIEKLKEIAPEGDFLYPPDMLTDQTDKFFISEIIREKIIHLTYQEVPHSVAVYVDEIEERKNGNLLYIRATIVVERPTQKAIIIGKDGQMLKKIGTLARMEIEAYYQKQVYLDLWVKVREKWRKKPEMLRELGYE
ncbi:GTPase Era [Dictyoglomus thermophilum]|uniref:GTPase Era n=2 Tax=Dictyoglomus thermophilum TaxID=14 RepID=B5YES8_DICT6|nr:GTPase Era [Dictyoglomus thermophilum]ACI19859.1 GTP-binding protein Era [Dictyoglomus thermophilum H-6-12]MCX7719707.1 GTPase Era [Dictyoglomus thermophilum]TYT21141.1 GTPase Era [Dictyoglomus thermophilum]